MRVLMNKLSLQTDALLLLKLMHHCYRKCCSVVTENAAL